MVGVGHYSLFCVQQCCLYPGKKYSPAALVQEDLQVMEQPYGRIILPYTGTVRPKKWMLPLQKAYAAIKDSMNESAFQPPIKRNFICAPVRTYQCAPLCYVQVLPGGTKTNRISSIRD